MYKYDFLHRTLLSFVRPPSNFPNEKQTQDVPIMLVTSADAREWRARLISILNDERVVVRYSHTKCACVRRRKAIQAPEG